MKKKAPSIVIIEEHPIVIEPDSMDNNTSLIQNVVGGILIFIGGIAFALGLLATIGALIILVNSGRSPSILGLFECGIFLFIAFWICAIGVRISPSGRAWLKSDKKESECTGKI